ncbi:MAG: hypothetical protein JW801_18020 [Bacteroidales bacterium]|nr:hypothetical protein [Bacteroidales bacterium]
MPLTGFIVAAIFGRSVITAIAIWISLMTYSAMFVFYIAGSMGIKSLFWALPAVFIFSPLVLLAIRHVIKIPLVRITQQVEKLAAGNLDSSGFNGIKGRFEIEILRESLSGLALKLSTLISEMQKSAGDLVSASRQLSSSSQMLSTSSNEQASSLEQISSTTEEISASTEKNTDHASQSQGIAKNASMILKELSGNAKKSLESVKNITNKISVINDIVLQTNILALNAAVEAARAGEHGRGFAVVAAEVRKLSERSRESAGQIQELSETSLGLTEETSILYEELVPEIEKNEQYTQEIASASMEQNSGISQVNSAVQQLSMLTKRNAAAADELAASGESLNLQAERMLNLLSHFRTDVSGVSASALQLETSVKDMPEPDENLPEVVTSGEQVGEF